MQQIGFIGLGVMGGPMAGHLLRGGLSPIVWNRSPAKSEPLAAAGAEVADSIESLAARCSLIMLCINRTEDVAEVCKVIAKSAAKGTLIVDHSTIAPEGAMQIAAELQSNGMSLMDAPITGGSMGAQKGTLTIFCGGEAKDYERALPAMQHYGKNIAHVGTIGYGQKMKLANQIAVGGALLALCESLAFAQRSGLDLAQTREMLAGGAAGSWAFENYGPKILNKDWTPGFSIKNQRKDFGYCRQAAESIGASIPGTELVDNLLRQLDEAGHGEWTTAALFELLAEGKP